MLTEYRGRRNAQRVFEALESLKQAVESKASAADALTEDQVVEVVHETFEELVKTSSEEKVKYLKNSLAKAFAADKIPYFRKQLYLSVLRDLSLAEIDLLRVIYLYSDPFVISHPLPRPQRAAPGDPYTVTVATTFGGSTWKTEYQEGVGRNLLEELAESLPGYDQGTLDGTIGALDSRALTRIRPNLDGRAIKIMTEVPNEQGGSVLYVPETTTGMLMNQAPRSTPIEASQTDFGREFIDYVGSAY